MWAYSVLLDISSCLQTLNCLYLSQRIIAFVWIPYAWAFVIQLFRAIRHESNAT